MGCNAEVVGVLDRRSTEEMSVGLRGREKTDLGCLWVDLDGSRCGCSGQRRDLREMWQ